MMLANRLGKATSMLSGKERAVLAIRAQNQGRTPDPEWLQIPDPAQRRQYDRYIGLAYVASAELGMLCQVIKNQADHAAGAVQAFEVIEEASGILADDLQVSVDQRKVRAWRKVKEVSVPVFLAGLALEVRQGAVAEVVTRWKELRALEQVWEALRAEFDGADPVVPEVRALADAAAATLRELAQRYRIKRLPEPEQEFIDRTWELVDQSFDLLKLVKEEP
jgi:hypothetical protein